MISMNLNVKKQENMTHRQDRKQQRETNPKMTQMLELADKNFKATLIKMLQQAINNTLEVNGKLESRETTEDSKNYNNKN